MKESELERLKRIENLAWEAVKPNPPKVHQQALAALRDALMEGSCRNGQDLRRSAVTQRIIEKHDE
ncbi:MAG: hypothetical protein JXA30_09145 [Deltaproteobacteria bacterium]|nr:hypothetical protein [Deltaproteobacteria bacterium]